MVEPDAGGPRGGPGEGAPSEEEVRAAIEEQLRTLRVEDVVMQSVATLMSLAGRRLGLAPGSEGERDLGQAQLAIEGTRALVGLVPEPDASAIREALSQIQLAFARLAGERGPAPQGAGDPGPAPAPEDPAAQPAGLTDEQRAAARAKIWTPGSS